MKKTHSIAAALVAVTFLLALPVAAGEPEPPSGILVEIQQASRELDDYQAKVVMQGQIKALEQSAANYQQQNANLESQRRDIQSRIDDMDVTVARLRAMNADIVWQGLDGLFFFLLGGLLSALLFLGTVWRVKIRGATK